MATLTKYHKTESGKLLPCTATKKPCKYGKAEHTFLSAAQQLFMRDVMGVIDPKVKLNLDSQDAARSELASEVLQEKPVSTAEVEAIIDRKLADQAFSEDYGVTREEWAQLISKPYSKNFSGYGFRQYDEPVEATWDYYGPEESWSNSEADNPSDEPAYMVYYGLHIDSDIDADRVAEKLFAPKNDLARRAAVGYVKVNGLDLASAYNVEARGDYYSQQIDLSITEAADKKVHDFMDTFPVGAPAFAKKKPATTGRGKGI